MIIEIPKPIHQPRRSIDIGYQISLSKVDDRVFEMDDFDEWLSYKAAELGTGVHSEYYLGDTTDEDCLVEFSVVLTTMSISDWINKGI